MPLNNSTLREAKRCGPECGARSAIASRTLSFYLWPTNSSARGLAPLLHAIARLKNPHLQLLAVVGRSRPESYQGKIKRLGLQDHVRFLGPKKDLAPYYAAADALALPTQYEAWGLVIVEALACGTRVLTSRLAGAAVTVREGETGELLDTPENVSEIAMKLEHLMHCGQIERAAVSASVQKFTWANVLEGYEMALKSSLSEPA